MYHVLTRGSNTAPARLNATRFKFLQQKGNLSSEGKVPRLWILASRHSGDNTQLNALANALGWPCETKRLAYQPYEELLRLTRQATLAGVNLAKSSPLSPPWPDLVISAGRSTEAVAFWIRKNGNPGVRLVFVGTPWASPSRFDLVITTPQYGLPKAANILHLPLPLHGVTPTTISTEAARWQDRLAHLPGPRIALLVGGNSGPYLFRPAAAARLGREASRMAAETGGSLLVTTSARTSKSAEEALVAAITAPMFLFRYEKTSADNPFHAFLGLADRIIVTADSISMLSEACSTGKPVALFDIEEGVQSMRAEEGEVIPGRAMPPIHWRGHDLPTTFFRFLMRHAPARWSRDLRIVHRHLIDTGMASWLGEKPREAAALPVDGLASAAARIREFFAL
jgi:uncharacterized protein